MDSSEARRHHFEVEKELATRLRNSTREERKGLAAELYSELYRRVPNHPRVARSKEKDAEERSIAAQLRLVRHALAPEVRFLEFGAGTGTFSKHVAPKVKEAIALEVCAQGSAADKAPANYRMQMHDGLVIPLPDGGIDVAFSYQVLEHLHPDDVELHFQEIARVLKPGGTYILSTPHALSGPHDVSRYFSEKLETFHLKEWTYGEMAPLMRRCGFTRIQPFLRGKTGPAYRLLLPGFRVIERALCMMPASLRTRVARKFLNNVVVCAFK
ncbi:class I SAM-dependent methyltransferase [Roseimicrobium gellanilyticum]|nr:class I SAM-dependent methyltransferase [Roseimicrobium gellanilyticum]